MQKLINIKNKYIFMNVTGFKISVLIILICFLSWMCYNLNEKTSTYDLPYSKTVTIVEKYDGFIISSDSEKYRADTNDKCFLSIRVGKSYNLTLHHRPYDNKTYIIRC